MLGLCIHLAAAIRGYLAFYMPTNRAVDWLRSPQGLKWAVPVAVVVAPTYLLAMSICMTLIERGGPGYLNVLMMLFAWNALKFVGLMGVATAAGIRRMPAALMQVGARVLGARRPSCAEVLSCPAAPGRLYSSAHDEHSGPRFPEGLPSRV